ncbi:imidazole glycerol phosphate synthase subunit HisH [Allobranchiibius sp. CTAmp26]|uniref:imidazole glycerol phosphate synthase subunit HisH n=1 Tax=Allobranchiibius sp. CTAmp26 TaxID=2815214 RepID=UPI001AA12C16|nr:imidazole glycerol phosphate synthase subunit HisH [Allobranchiibius sp. CTAmp26]MBO1754484.1 imidazole glycerol phosphate synthase subunit HisH [Allobranchiibius sp. CTAmp26]
MKRVVVLDYGSGNVRSVVRMLERVGAHVELTADPEAVRRADGLYVPGVGNFHACVAGLRRADGPALIAERLAAGLPVLGVCVGFQVLFEGSTEHYATDALDGIGLWPGTVTRLTAPVVPHMGWSQVQPASGSTLFDGIEDEWFYFVHSYAALRAPGAGRAGVDRAPLVSTAEHGEVFVAAVEDGALGGTQFHPEKSGDAGATLIENWLASF